MGLSETQTIGQGRKVRTLYVENRSDLAAGGVDVDHVLEEIDEAQEDAETANAVQEDRKRLPRGGARGPPGGGPPRLPRDSQTQHGPRCPRRGPLFSAAESVPPCTPSQAFRDGCEWVLWGDRPLRPLGSRGWQSSGAG